MARPSSYTPEMADLICADLALGMSLRSICRCDDRPDMTTVMRWLREREEFRQQYARAKEEAADGLVEEMLEIADTPVEGVRTKHTADGVEETREDMLGHRRLQVDTRKWIASKLKPKKYGDKIEHDHKGNVALGLVINDKPKEAAQ